VPGARREDKRFHLVRGLAPVRALAHFGCFFGGFYVGF